MGAKQSTPSGPTLGLTYRAVNSKTQATINALQKVLSSAQNIWCGVVPLLIKELKAFPIPAISSSDIPSSSVLILLITGYINEMPAFNELTSIGFPSSQTNALKSALVSLITVVINNANKNGTVDISTALQNVYDILNSLCPNPATINLQANGKKINIITSYSKSSFGSTSSNTLLIIIIIVVAIFLLKKRR